MTAGERSGRDFGHDDSTWPAFEAGGFDDSGPRQSAGAWTEPDPWGPVPQQPVPQQPTGWADRDPWAHGAGVYESGHPGPPAPAGDLSATGQYPLPPVSSGSRATTGDGDRPLPPHRSPGRPGRAPRKGMPLWQELPLLLVIAFCLAILVRTFLLQAFYIPSGSMEDTLIAGDRVLVNKVVYHFREPARGEVVVFEGTDAWAPIDAGNEDIGSLAKVGRAFGDLVGISRPGAKDYIKRVVALPGDTVSCCDVEGRVFVNGEPLNEPYVIRNSPLDDAPAGDCRGRRFDEVVVQPGQMFVMGDHRQVSQDSRCQGQVPIDNVIGRAFVIVWPSDRGGTVSRSDSFERVPEPLAAPSALAPPGPAGVTLAFVLPVLLPLCPQSRAVRGVAGFRR